MRISEIQFQGPPPIESYFDGGFRIGGVLHYGSAVLIGPDILNWPVGHASELNISVFKPMIDRASEFDALLIGMGAEISPLPRKLRETLEECGIGVDIMATPAACRTYNVLLSEGRRAAAALIAAPVSA